jgi:propionate CoA-transferase
MTIPPLVKKDLPFQSEEKELEGIKKVVSRRAAKELREGFVANLGYGMSDGVPLVVRNSELFDTLTFVIEQGTSGGIPTTGLNFGAMYNPSSILDDGYQFDFFQGGGIDIAFLGFAQIDKEGNVNSSRFGKVLTGCGGFIDISQSAKEVVFCGSFSVKSDIDVNEEGLVINHPGKFNKFINEVEQVTFSAELAKKSGQSVYYVTERAVFKLSQKGIVLVEVAPGADLKKDILDMMDFDPIVSPDLVNMDYCIFSNSQLELSEKSNRGV